MVFAPLKNVPYVVALRDDVPQKVSEYVNFDSYFMFLKLQLIKLQYFSVLESSPVMELLKSKATPEAQEKLKEKLIKMVEVSIIFLMNIYFFL